MSKQKSQSPFVYSTDPAFVAAQQEQHINEALPKQQQKLKVLLSKKHRAGKMVTLIEGLTATDNEKETIGKTLKTLCGTGGSVKDGEIIVQGDHRDKVLQWLHKNGYSAAKKL